MSKATLFVCALCRFSAEEKSRDGRSGGDYFIEQLQRAIAERNLQEAVQIEPVRCVAACSCPCNATLAAPHKLTFILSGLSLDGSATALSKFCQQYAECPTGKVPYRERSPIIHQAIAFILPPLQTDD